MSKRIYILRHGQTELNIKGICQGINDSPLTELSQFQALKAKQYIDSHNFYFDVVYSSPLKRALDTARLVTGSEPIIERRLIEVDFGDITGKEYSLHKNYPEGFKAIGGEDYIDAANRFEEALLDMVSKDEDDILCVSHGAVMKSFYNKLTGENKDHVLPNLGIMVIDYDGDKFKFIRNIDTQIEWLNIWYICHIIRKESDD